VLFVSLVKANIHYNSFPGASKQQVRNKLVASPSTAKLRGNVCSGFGT